MIILSKLCLTGLLVEERHKLRHKTARGKGFVSAKQLGFSYSRTMHACAEAGCTISISGFNHIFITVCLSLQYRQQDDGKQGLVYRCMRKETVIELETSAGRNSDAWLTFIRWISQLQYLKSVWLQERES